MTIDAILEPVPDADVSIGRCSICKEEFHSSPIGTAKVHERFSGARPRKASRCRPQSQSVAALPAATEPNRLVTLIPFAPDLLSTNTPLLSARCYMELKASSSGETRINFKLK